MLSLHPDEQDLADPQPLAEAIEDLCDVVDDDRASVIVGLAELLRRRTAFETLRQRTDLG